MRKLTAGIFTLLLGLVSVGTANAAVVSTEYLNQKLGVIKLDQVGGENKYIKSVAQTNGAVTAETGNIDTAVTANSTNLITSGAVSTAISAANSEVTNLKKTVAANTAGIDGLVQNSATKEELTTAQNDLTLAIATAKQEAITAANNAEAPGSAANLAKAAQNDVDTLETEVSTYKTTQAEKDSAQDANITKNANAITAMDAAYKKADADAKTAADAAYAAKSYESIVDADKAWRESIQKAEKGSVAGNYALTATVGENGATAYKWELISR